MRVVTLFLGTVPFYRCCKTPKRDFFELNWETKSRGLSWSRWHSLLSSWRRKGFSETSGLHQGAAAGPMGMNADHLRPRISSSSKESNCHEQRRPPVIVDVIRLGRITTLQKPSGGVRGIVVGDIFRTLFPEQLLNK